MVTLIVILSYLSIHQILSSNCTQSNPCQNQYIGCASDSDECILNCNGYRSCLNVTYNCDTTNKQCIIRCNGGFSCENAKFISNVNSQASLTCIGEESCLNYEMTTRGSFNVNCNGRIACNQMSIYQDGKTLNNYVTGSVSCNDYEASCESLDLTVTGGSSINGAEIQCFGNSVSCQGIEFNCNYTNPLASCLTSCETDACDESNTLYCNNGADCTTTDYDLWNVIGGGPVPSLSTTPSPIQDLQNFVFINNAKTWFGAQKYCQQEYNSSLGTITNNIDFENINKYSNMSSDRWIGLNNYYQDDWQWVDGTLWLSEYTHLCSRIIP